MSHRPVLWPYVAFVWVLAWLSLPVLPSYLPIPGYFGSPLLWARLAAMTVIPACICLFGALADTSRRPLAIAILSVGIVAESLYVLHFVSMPTALHLIERWGAALMALTALFLCFRSYRQNAPPAMEILASGALALTFIARPLWADGISSTILAMTFGILFRRQSHQAQ